MWELLQYDFIVRGLITGIIVAVIAPLIGIFLVLRRYSLIADSLAHASLAGIAVGLFFGINPIYTALLVSVASSLGIERLRMSKSVYGESALAIFLSGGLAVAVTLLSLAQGFNTNLFNYLFGSLVTVSAEDIYTILLIGVVVIVALAALYKELVYISFDEESARVSGIPTGFLNSLLIILAALTVALAIPIVGVLLIGSLMVIPVVTALQYQKSFKQTIIIAEIVSLISVIAGIVVSFYANLATGGTIVLVMLALFLISLGLRKNN
jgi:zinc transport system permease protein